MRRDRTRPSCCTACEILPTAPRWSPPSQRRRPTRRVTSTTRTSPCGPSDAPGYTDEACAPRSSSAVTTPRRVLVFSQYIETHTQLTCSARRPVAVPRVSVPAQGPGRRRRGVRRSAQPVAPGDALDRSRHANFWGQRRDKGLGTLTARNAKCRADGRGRSNARSLDPGV